MSKAMFLSTIPRVLLGIIFLIFGIDGFVYVFTGSSLIVPPVSEAGGQFIASLQASGFFWPFMKTIYIVAALCLLTNRAPALGIALLIPIIAVIILFHAVLNPAGIPIAVILAVLGGLVFFANRDKFAGLLQPTGTTH